MLFDRFDSAVLYFFSYEQLAGPFTVEQRGLQQWEVMRDGASVGTVTVRMFYGITHYRAVRAKPTEE